MTSRKMADIVTEYKKLGNRSAHIRRSSSNSYKATGIIVAVGFLVIAVAYGILLQSQQRKMLTLLEEVKSNKETISMLKDECMKVQGEVSKSKKPHDRKGSFKSPAPLLRRERSASDTVPDAFMGTHLVGTIGRIRHHCRRSSTRVNYNCLNQQRPAAHKYFEWNSSHPDLWLDSARVDLITNSNGTFVSITSRGYYYVYSQVTYYSRGLLETGHEVVRNVGSREVVLMSYINMQRMGTVSGNGDKMRTLDSGYNAGVFYLYEHDKIGVRPVNWGIGNQRFLMEPSKSFFGLYFIQN